MSLKFTPNTKSTLDIIVPVAGAGITAYYLFKNKKADLQKTAITAAIVLVVLYVVTTQITKRALASAQKPPDAIVTPDVSGTIDNNSTTSAGFNAKGYAQRLYKDIKGINWASGFGLGVFGLGNRDDELYASMVLLSNQNLQLIYNAWQSNYYSELNETVVHAMKGETYPNLTTGTNDNVQQILKRYANLGLA